MNRPTATRAVYHLDGLCCPSEGKLVDAALERLAGIAHWSVSYGESTVTVEFAPGGEGEHVTRALGQTGLRLVRVSTGRQAVPMTLAQRARALLPLMVATAFTAAGAAGAILGRPTLGDALYLAAVLVGGVPTARRAVASLAVRRIDMHVLMMIAVLGALGIGEWLEAAIVVLLFGVANALEAYSVDRARRAVEQLFDLTPPFATVRRNGEDVQLPADEIVVDDIVVLRPGDRIPVDGTVVGGRSDVDQSPVTGESRLVPKSPGDAAFAGTLNVDGVLEVRADRPAGESTPARMQKLVEEARAGQAPIERYIDRFASRYTPVIVGLAAVVATLPPLLTGTPAGPWMYRALVLLVIACPCALVISIPVALVCHLAGAARQGILIKGGAHLENLARVCSIVFDKTGTLTRGRPRVVHVSPLNGLDEAGVLRYAAAVEARASHPLASVICAAARDAGVDVPDADTPHTHPGQGLHATVDGRDVWVGTLAMAGDAGPHLATAEATVREHEAHGETTVVVGSGADTFGVIALADEARPEAREVIAQLRDAGFHHLYMLTGDNRAVAESMKAELGLDDAFAELLPEDKVAAVRRLLADEHAVAMVGDGINDAPALAAATVGVAMGAGGSDIAVEAADVTLLGDDLSALPRAVAIARSAMRIVKQNIAIALGLKLVVFALAMAGIATLWLAILADTGASLLVIANALRGLAPRTT